MYLPVLANYMYLVLYVFRKLALPDPWPLCWFAAGYCFYWCSLQLQRVSGFLIIRSWMQQFSCSCTKPCSWDIYLISLFYIWCFSLCSPKFFPDFFFPLVVIARCQTHVCFALSTFFFFSLIYYHHELPDSIAASLAFYMCFRLFSYKNTDPRLFKYVVEYGR